ncbi:hypothetical protein JJC04_12820 [Flavobacterium covae]|nr:hypothetical protein [Flavobacterium covae]QYS90820.1 hypothetical protein JJC04_12820 [Flavobacterium covae]
MIFYYQIYYNSSIYKKKIDATTALLKVRDTNKILAIKTKNRANKKYILRSLETTQYISIIIGINKGFKIYIIKKLLKYSATTSSNPIVKNKIKNPFS